MKKIKLNKKIIKIENAKMSSLFLLESIDRQDVTEMTETKTAYI